MIDFVCLIFMPKQEINREYIIEQYPTAIPSLTQRKEFSMKPINSKTENEIPKYLKSTESSISKSNRKSKHKHHYEECLIQNKWNFKSNAFTQEEKERIHTSLSSYCIICGKIGGIIKNSKYQKEIKALQKQRQTGNNFLESISSEEIYEMYHDKMSIFFLEDIFAKYIDLEQNDYSDRE